MRAIRFTPKMLERVRQRAKVKTLRPTRHPPGVYKVEEGARSWFDHVDTGLRIEILHSFQVADIEAYARQFYREEGFGSAEEFLRYLKEEVYRGKKPPSIMFSHTFRLLEA